MTPDRADILQIVPAGSGGVPDHAGLLAAAWSRMGYTSATMTGRALQGAGPGFRPAETALLIHMSAYGYARYGLCFWLPAWLSRVRRRHPGARVVTLFHEVATWGYPWTTAFWSSFPQKAIARRLAGLSDAIVTNSSYHRQALEALGVDREIACWPVFSNVGELTANPAQGGCTHAAVLFGSEPLRRQALRRIPPAAWRRLRAFGDIIEIGSGGRVGRAEDGFEWLGELSPGDLSRVLSRAKFGIVGHEGICLAKSGSFAAYAAHGCAPIVAQPAGAEGDGLITGRHMFDAHDMGAVTEGAIARVSQTVFDWHQDHTIHIQAEAFMKLLIS